MPDNEQKAAATLQSEMESEAVVIYDLKAQKMGLERELVILNDKKADAEKDVKNYEESLVTLRADFSKLKDEVNTVKAEIEKTKEEEKARVDEERGKLTEERKSLESDRDDHAKAVAKFNDDEANLQQRSKKVDVREEALDKRESHINILNEKLKNDKKSLIAHQDEVEKMERAVRNKQTNLESLDASLQKQEGLLKELEVQAQERRDEANKANSAVVAATAKMEKLKSVVENRGKQSEKFYRMAKDAYRNIIGLANPNEQGAVVKMLAQVFQLEVPLDDGTTAPDPEPVTLADGSVAPTPEDTTPPADGATS